MESNILFLTVKIVSIETDQMASEDALVFLEKRYKEKQRASYVNWV